MRPIQGVTLEVLALAGLLALAPLVPPGFPFALFVVIAELAATYLVHCPAHYVVGAAAGIRFRRMRLGRTTLASVLPEKLVRLARLLPILTLSTEKTSLSRASNRAVAIMYASGTIASASSAIIVAGAAIWVEPVPYTAPAWAVALAYLAFDIVFSPKSGDLMRAKASLGL